MLKYACRGADVFQWITWVFHYDFMSSAGVYKNVICTFAICKPSVAISIVWATVQKPRDIHFSIMENQDIQQIDTTERLKPLNFGHFFFSWRKLIIKIVTD